MAFTPFPLVRSWPTTLPPERREAELARLFKLGPKLTAQVIREDYSVLEDPGFSTGIVDGTLRVDRLTPARAGIVSLIVAQSAAMEYYERIVDRLSTRTGTFVERLERRGTVPLRTRRLHRFIGEAISTRSEVLQVLDLLDKPDAAWDDPEMDRIYGDSRADSTWSIAIGRWNSSCAPCKRRWSC